MSIGEKLFKIQQEMNVPKDLYNKYAQEAFRGYGQIHRSDKGFETCIVVE